MSQRDGQNSKFYEFVREVKQRTHLADLVKEDVPSLTQKGGHWSCSSPFRKDSTPSFVVYDDGGWHDFGTAERGDCFGYVIKRDNTDFKGAVSVLARRAGMELYWETNKKDSPEDVKYIDEVKMLSETNAVFELLTEAASYYHKCLPSKIRENYYNKVYGLTDETIDKLSLGWANGGLADYFLEKGYQRSMCLKTGLFRQHDGKLIDFFEDRLFIPYFKDNKVVYVIARKTEYTDQISDYEKAKYKKLRVYSTGHPEISEYISNDHFFNEDVCSKKIDEIIITEGVTDCIAAAQHKFNCLSPVTVRFREKDIPKLIEILRKSQVRTVFLCNDADVLEDGREPGKEGALATAGALAGAGFAVRMCELPRPPDVKKVDLCEFLRDHGAVALRKVLDESMDLIDYQIDQIPTNIKETEINSYLNPIIETIVRFPDFTRDAYEKRILSKFKNFGMKATTLRKRISASLPKTELKTTADLVNDSEEPKKLSAYSPNDTDRGQIYEDLKCYHILKHQKNGSIQENISSFILKVKEKIKVNGDEILICDIHCQNGKIYIDHKFNKNSFDGKKEFIRSLPSVDCGWTGNDDEVNCGLRRLLSMSEVPTKIATTNLGYDDSDGIPKWVWPGGIITNNGFEQISDSIVYMPDGSSVGDRLNYINVKNEEIKLLAASVLPSIFNLNTNSVIVPIVGWFYSTPFKSRINKILGHFPILHIWGSAGSGKTSIVRDIFWPLLGISQNRNEPYSCNDTYLPIVKKISSTDSVPIFFDEYKPSDMMRNKVKDFHRILRRAYGGETEERGKQDQTTTSVYLKAPIVIAGEMAIQDDQALLERIISVEPNTNSILNTKDIFKKIKSLELNKLSASFISWSLTVDVDNEIKESMAHLDSLLIRIKKSNKYPPRVYDNFVVMIFGIRMFEQWAESLDVILPKIDINKTLFDVTENIIDGEEGYRRDTFDEFLEQLSIIATSSTLNCMEGKHYRYIKDKLCLNLTMCYNAYCIERRKLGKDDFTGGKRALKKLAEEKMHRGDSYVLDTEHRFDVNNGFGMKRVHGIKIDLDKIPTHLDIQQFPRNNPQKDAVDDIRNKSN